MEMVAVPGPVQLTVVEGHDAPRGEQRIDELLHLLGLSVRHDAPTLGYAGVERNDLDLWRAGFGVVHEKNK